MSISKLDTLSCILETSIHTMLLKINVLMYQCTNVLVFPYWGGANDSHFLQLVYDHELKSLSVVWG
jgi:hypothetical protein